jgi:hypothetical protein
LLAEGKVLQSQIHAGADQRTQGPEDGDEHREHGGILPAIPGPVTAGRRSHQRGWDFGEAQAQTQEIDPKGTPAVRIFKPGKTMIYGYQVLNAQAGPGQPPQLEVQTRLFRDGQAIYSGQPQIVKMGDQPDPKHLMAGGPIQLGAKIAAADYVLRVVVTDKLARRAATQSIDFSVE